ncbi:MAG TPA: BatD family protein [Steroidobacteraceae bacterium]|nr:BatD family protein [Steroidobacteraceae bacterium]
MKSPTPCRWFIRAVLLPALLAGLAPVWASSRVTMTLDPPTFDVGEASQLTIVISGDEDAVPIIPHVSGLVINPEGQSTSIQQINGAVTTYFARTYRVTATQEGTFTIPSIRIGSLTTAPLTVRVGAPGSANPARSGQQAAPQDRTTATDVAAALRAAMPMMKVILPTSRLYVGELVPIQIKVYFKEGVSPRLEGPLVAVGDAFTVSGLDKQATQTEELVGVTRYAVLTWNAVLGALKSGSYPIGLELPASVSVQLHASDADVAARLRALFGTAASSAFMDEPDLDEMFGRVIRKSVTVKPDAPPVTVLPLPAAGRPADFSGAVGQFEITGELAPRSGAVGDPLTFKLTVSGRGNLSRISSEVLHDSPQWRTYRADSKVTADDESGLKGFKTFSQPVVPLQAGQLTLPGLSFSYFDPEAERYVTRQTAPIRVMITPGAGGPQSAVAGQGGAGPTGGAQGAGADALAADAAATGGVSRSLESVLWRPWFMGAALAPVILMMAAVTAIRRQRRRAGDPALRRQAAHRTAVRINLEHMASALDRGDSAAFFAAARRALQERLAERWQVSADSVDPQWVAGTLPPEHGAPLQAIFAMADKAVYGAESLGPQALQEWERRVLEQLKRLESA